MKKWFSLSLVTLFVLSVVILTSCGSGGSDADLSDSKYVGTWKATSIIMGDEYEELEEEYVLTLKEDGTGTLTGGEEETSNFKWKPVDGGFKTSGDVKTKFTDDGEEIKTSILGATLVFEKQ